ncbi:MAG: aminotransferase class I/II-fold pyridoxal phosphate-dependent enzyme [Syntrophorhabdaceae bacterium]|nr:aminotransferase class I/II-fold pyridoxal phosphate-dependent enzyme [Syntrophorhabdaceae bacterium]
MHNKKIFDFTDNINPLNTSKRVKNNLRRSIKHIESYDDTSLSRFIRYLKKLFNIEEENILVCYGLSHILSCVLKMSGGSDILIPSPVSGGYRFFIDSGDVKIVPYKTDINDDNYCNIEDLSQFFDKIDLILLPNPHNITGKILSNKQIEDIIGLADKMKKTVIIDESLIDYTEMPTYAENIVKSECSLIVKTFSTYHGLAGLLFGYAIGPNKLIKDLKKFIYPFSFKIPPLACSAALVSMKDAAYKRRTNEYISSEKTYIKDRLKSSQRIKIIDRGCNFLLVEIEGDKDAVFDFFYKKGINIDIYQEPEGLFLRLPIKKHKLNAYFVKILKKMIGETKL